MPACKHCRCPGFHTAGGARLQGAFAEDVVAKRPRTHPSRPPRADVSGLLWRIGAPPAADTAADAEAAALLLSISCSPQALLPCLREPAAAPLQPESPMAEACGEREPYAACPSSSGGGRTSVASGAGGDAGVSGGVGGGAPGAGGGAGAGLPAAACKPFRCLRCGGAAVLRGEKRPTFHCAACLTAAGARKRAQRALFGGHVVGTSEAALLVKSGIAASALPQARPRGPARSSRKRIGACEQRSPVVLCTDGHASPLHGFPGAQAQCTVPLWGAQRAFHVALSAQEGAEQRPQTLQAPVAQDAGGRGPGTKQERCKRGARLGYQKTLNQNRAVG